MGLSSISFVTTISREEEHYLCSTTATTLCKGEDGVQQQLALYQTYYNFCLPHVSLRQPLAQPEPTKGTGSARMWRPCTPAMAAGLTEQVWTLREMLLFRVPPWQQPQVL